jgi:hypothetical protein
MCARLSRMKVPVRLPEKAWEQVPAALPREEAAARRGQLEPERAVA